MRTTGTNEEVVSAWIKQNQEYMRNGQGSLSFRGSVLYSYRMPVAMIVNTPSGKATFVCNDSPTMTTAKHKSSAYSYAPGPALETPAITNNIQEMIDKAAKEAVNQQYNKIFTARDYAEYRVMNYAHQKALIKEFAEKLDAITPVMPEIPDTTDYFFKDIRNYRNEKDRPQAKTIRILKKYDFLNLEYKDEAIREPITGRRFSIITENKEEAEKNAAYYLRRYTPEMIAARLAKILL